VKEKLERMAFRVAFTCVVVLFIWEGCVWEGCVWESRGVWVLEFGGVCGMKSGEVESACVDIS